MKAQKDYYKLDSAADVIEKRIETLRSVIPAGSTVLDVGCNDGTISRALLESGHASEVTGVDLENIVDPPHPSFRVIVGNIGELDLAALPRTDVVLLLNVMHHVVGKEPARARRVIKFFLERSKFIILDMGSFTERGQWGWRRTYDRHWSNDGEMWDDLFASAAARFKLLTYRTQGNGTRVMWKLVGRYDPPQQFEVVQRYRRNVAAFPKHKKLYPVADEFDAPVPFGSKAFELFQGTIFALLRSNEGDLYWSKKLCSRTAELGMRRSREIYNALANAPFRIVQPVAEHPDHGFIWPYDPELFTGEVIHYHDRITFLTPAERQMMEELGEWKISVLDKPEARLVEIVDFQAVRTAEGLKFIDFDGAPRKANRSSVTLAKSAAAVAQARAVNKVDAVPTSVMRRARRLAGNAVRAIDLKLRPVHFKPPFTQRDIRTWKRMPVEQQRAMLAPILEKYILQWDWLAESAGRDRADLPLIFTHMPKTAGMTLEAIISQNYYSYHLVHIDGPNAERNPSALFKQGVLPTVAMGHYEFNHILFLALRRPTAHITMLREPVRRVISYYNWVRRSEKHPLHEKLSTMTLREFAGSSIGGGRLEASNGQTLRIAGRIGKRFETDPSTHAETLELAKHHLLTTYSMFGVQERFDDFLLMARAVLGWRDIYHRSRNQSVEGIKLKEVDEETIAIIRERNRLDVQLHEFASAVFAERCQDLAIGPENVERFRQANVEYQRLLDLTL